MLDFDYHLYGCLYSQSRLKPYLKYEYSSFGGTVTITTPYYEAIQMIERLHRHFLDVLKVELDRKGIKDINNIQTMILYNMAMMI